LVDRTCEGEAGEVKQEVDSRHKVMHIVRSDLFNEEYGILEQSLQHARGVYGVGVDHRSVHADTQV